jgi:hypothetical protein
MKTEVEALHELGSHSVGKADEGEVDPGYRQRERSDFTLAGLMQPKTDLSLWMSDCDFTPLDAIRERFDRGGKRAHELPFGKAHVAGKLFGYGLCHRAKVVCSIFVLWTRDWGDISLPAIADTSL